MTFKDILKKIKSKVFKKKLSFQNENDYYEELFVKNEKWNTYEPNEEELLRWEIIRSYINEVKATNNFNILDLGSGRGWLSNLMSQFGNVIGVEPVENVVSYAKQLYNSVNFLHGTSKDLLDNYLNHFDLIVSSEVIEHIVDDHKDEFVKDIFSLLKKNGFAIITTPRKDVQKEWFGYFNANQPVEDWIYEKDLESLFLKNGFKSLKMDRIPVKPNFNSPFIEIYQVWLFRKND